MSSNTPTTLIFSAGEASGDQHAANMFAEIQKIRPEIKALGMGSTHMKKAGIDIRIDSANIAVIGVVEVIKHYPEIRRALTTMQQLVATERPALLICVDYKEFNFKLAKFAKRIGIKVLFYVSPQVWAWRPNRAKKYGQVIDMMAVIFPFETIYYERENIPVRYVGHPSIDKVKPRFNKIEAFNHFGLNDQHPVVGLLPGSRHGEIRRMLPEMLAAVTKLKTERPDIQFMLLQAPSISDEQIQQFLADNPVPIKLVKDHPYDAMQCCSAIMTTSGTATLEIALLAVPMVIGYRLSPITYWLGRLLVKIPFIGLPNIMAGKRIVKELIQHEATAEGLASEILTILTDHDYADKIHSELVQVKNRLGEGGGSKNMALLVLEMLDSNKLPANTDFVK